MYNLKDKVIFLTGGTEGIGWECAKSYLRQGAKLIIISNSAESIAQASEQIAQANVRYIQADVANYLDVESAMQMGLAQFGRIDVIHNNAGIASPSKTLDDTTDEEWERLFQVNVKGIFNTTRAGIEALKKSKGNILNTSSLVADIGQEIHAAYSATKGAVNSLTKSMALDYAPFGIRVNAVSPAGVWTPMLRKWSQEQPNSADIEAYLDGIHTLGYCPEGDVIADACLFLISEQARFITGCILPISGGAELGYRRTQ